MCKNKVRPVSDRALVLPRDRAIPGLVVVHIKRFPAGDFHNAHESTTTMTICPVTAAQTGVAGGFRCAGRKINSVAEHFAGDGGIGIQLEARAEDVEPVFIFRSMPEKLFLAIWMR